MHNKTAVSLLKLNTTQIQKDCISIPEPVFVNLLRSPGIHSQPGDTDSLESIPRLLKRLQLRALLCA